MSMSVVLLLLSFVLSLGGLFIFIASMTRGLFGTAEEGSRVIFAPDEENTSEEPAASRADQARLQAEIRGAAGTGTLPEMSSADVAARIKADQSSAGPVLLCLSLAVLWLVLGSLGGLISSLKLHLPDWLDGQAWLTFGRIRPAHLNAVIYGWSSLAGVGIALWLIPRLFESTNASSWFQGPSTLWALGASAAETLFDAGRRHAVKRQAVAAYEQNAAEYRQTVLQAFEEVENTLAATQILAREAVQQGKAVDDATHSLSLSTSLYKQGLASYLQVITVQTILLANQANAVDIAARRATSSVQLFKALGGGWNAAALSDR
jgi:hypothetical protein